jgi:hypothetical protein
MRNTVRPLSNDPRQRLRARLYALRGVSAIITAGVLIALYTFIGPLAVVAGVIITAFAMTLPVVGGLVSVFTLWTGYGISSCPNCPAFSAEEVTVNSRECAVCGEVEHQLGMYVYGWTHHMTEDEWTCSIDCSQAFREGDR